MTKGPLCDGGDTRLGRDVVDGLHRICRQHHVQCLVVQPRDNGEALAENLPRWGFQPSKIDVAQSATVVVNLTKSLDELLADMNSNTRHNIRRSERARVAYREATESDLDAFYGVHLESSRRQNFKPYPLDYFRAMWRWLAARLFRGGRLRRLL